MRTSKWNFDRWKKDKLGKKKRRKNLSVELY